MFWLGDEGQGTNTEGMGLMDYRMGGRVLENLGSEQNILTWVTPSSGWDSHQCLYSVQQRLLFCHPRAMHLVPKGLRRKYYYWIGGNTADQVTTLGSRALEEGSYFLSSDGCVALVLKKWCPYWRDLGQNEILSNCKAEAGWKCWNNIRPGQQDRDQGVIWSSHSPPRLPSL